MVSPPPGVSSADNVPPIASVSPRATASPSPRPSPFGTSPSRWNGANNASRADAGIPGPWSTTRSDTQRVPGVVDPARAPDQHRRAGRGVP